MDYNQAKQNYEFWLKYRKGLQGKKAIMINNRVRFYERIASEFKTASRQRYLGAI